MVCAIIEISVEFFAICLYLFAFYRIFYTKRRLRKSMNVRDEARSSLWLAKLREQKEAEEGFDPETSKNTAYNQLNYNSAATATNAGAGAAAAHDQQPNSNAAMYDAEEGHAVPILQPAPARSHATARSDASDAPLRPGPLPKLNLDVPPTPRSVTFSHQPPPTPGLRT